MPRRTRNKLKEAIEANKALLKKIEEYDKAPDLILSPNDLIKGLSKAVEVVIPLVTPYGWTYWALKIGGGFIKGAVKKKEVKGDK